MTAANIEYVIPFYSDLKYLERCLESIRNQTMSNWRALVVDDRGPHSSGAKDLIAALHDSRISYHLNERNLGIAGNWNRCLELAKADYVTILHSDDELVPTYGEEMLEMIKQNPEASMYFCKTDVIGEDSSKLFSVPDYVKEFLIPKANQKGFIEVKGDAGLASILKGNYIFCPTICYKMNLMRSEKFRSEFKMVLDLDMIARVLFKGETIIGSSKRLFRYRRHSKNATKILSDELTRFQEEAMIYTAIGDQARKVGWVKSERCARKKRIIKLNLLFCIVTDLLKGSVSRARAKFRFLRSVGT